MQPATAPDPVGADAATAVATPVKGEGAHTPPPTVEVTETWAGPDGEITYRCRAGWTVLADEDDGALAELFSVDYLVEGGDSDRPVTFVFNGGPGASSVFLHIGALGPRRVVFSPDGRIMPSPARLTGNAESWLPFTDLVFVDPVGTGFSRIVKPGKDDGPAEGTPAAAEKGRDPRAFYGFTRDLESLGEFVSRWLSVNGRWASPVLVAGESYGGYRAAKMVRLLAENHGVGLAGAVLISPALEFSLLEYGDYDVLPYVDAFPTMAATAFLHGRAPAFAADTPIEEVFAAAEAFATGEYATFLVQGLAMDADRRAQTMDRAAGMIGLDAGHLLRAEGRLAPRVFARELLRDEGRIVAMYDGSYSAHDPFPDRAGYEAPDPTLQGMLSTYAGGINARLRGELGLVTDRIYEVLSYAVHTGWTIDIERHAFETQLGATDDLRYGMQLQPHVRVFLTHGRFDLVTPYHASDRLRNLMRLPGDTGDRFRTRHYPGGHMFYAWDESRVAFRDDIATFYAEALGHRTAGSQPADATG
ncbi:carboxypeptidase [soil metagenome]